MDKNILLKSPYCHEPSNIHKLIDRTKKVKPLVNNSGDKPSMFVCDRLMLGQPTFLLEDNENIYEYNIFSRIFM